MNRDLHEQADALFLELCDLAPEEARQRLEERRAEAPELAELVAGMLASDSRGDSALDGSALELLDLAPGAPPDRIGAFRVVGELGRGGMGVVYEAEQDFPRRRVALKVLRPGLTTPSRVARFEHEASLLAWLNHPGIAQIYEAGVAQGPLGPRPYFALELVRGLPLTRACAQRGLDLRARVELLAEICDAVHHAHQKGVLHRDLKPANLLVDEAGRPKVLDFGVARALDGAAALTLETRAGELVGTLAYMSPEQLEGDPAAVDVRADVYSLGVVLFEVLCGRLPIEAEGLSLAEAVAAIRLREAPRLSSLAAVPADVATIVAKALEKDRERRYRSAEALGEDLRRFLAHMPIAARPPSAVDQARKFARRNRALVGGAAAALALLVAGSVTSTALYLETASARRRERVEAETALEVSTFLEALFEGTDPTRTDGEPLTAVQLLERGTARIESDLAGRPQVQARLLGVIGHAQASVGNPEVGRALLERALERLEALPGDLRAARARTLRRLAAALNTLGRSTEAMERLVQAEGLLRALHGDDGVPGSLYCEQGLTKLHATENEAARALLERGIARIEASGEPPSGDLASYQAALAGVLDRLREHEAGEAAWTRAQELHERVHPGDDPRKAGFLGHRAHALMARRRLEEAIALQRSALSMSRRMWGDPHTEVAYQKVGLARMLLQAGRPEEAEREAREATEQYAERLPGRDTIGLALARGARAAALRALQRPEEAETEARLALAIYVELRGPLHEGTLALRDELIGALSQQGRLDDAAALSLENIEARAERFGATHEATFRAWAHLAAMLRKGGRAEGALQILEAQAEAASEALGRGDVSAVVLAYQLAYTLRGLDRLEESEAVLEALVPLRHQDPRTPATYRASILRELGEVCEARGRHEQAAAWRRLLEQEAP